MKSNFKTNRAKLVPNGRVVSKQNIVFIFKPIRHKNCLCKPWFLSDQNKMRNFVEDLLNITGIPAKFLFNQLNSFKMFFFLNIGQSETKIAYHSHVFCVIKLICKIFCRWPSQHNSCKVWFQLASQFQRRLTCETFTDVEQTTNNMRWPKLTW